MCVDLAMQRKSAQHDERGPAQRRRAHRGDCSRESSGAGTVAAADVAAVAALERTAGAAATVGGRRTAAGATATRGASGACWDAAAEGAAAADVAAAAAAGLLEPADRTRVVDPLRAAAS